MAAARPNILVFMCDQLQGRALDPDGPCLTPAFDRLNARGVRFLRAYTPNAVCSPARASLMTGLLPHNHGVLEVTHNVDSDQSCLRTEKPHWAQRLRQSGYRTGYFGKWHVERSNDLDRFGWDVNGSNGAPLYKVRAAEARAGDNAWRTLLERTVDNPPGYRKTVLYGVTERPPNARGMGISTGLALDFLDDILGQDAPWCCFVSLTEPHDPFVVGSEAYAHYDVDALELPPNANDDLADKPGLYRKCARVWNDLSERERREARACYYALVTEIDGQFARLVAKLEAAGALDDTLILVTSDHGELLGAHGLYCKNISAFEEVYNIPLIVAGPGVAKGAVCDARLGLHDVCPTLVELAGGEPIPELDSTSFAPLLAAPAAGAERSFGFAEYHGGRYRLTQRIVWDGPWKFVHNGFDEDELYNLVDDPWELRNLCGDPRQAERVRTLTEAMWRVVGASGDHSLFNSDYPPLRLAPVGPREGDASLRTQP